MSLTREEFVEMWKDIKSIENLALDFKSTGIPFKNRIFYATLILNKVKPIKDKIQQVIGQME